MLSINEHDWSKLEHAYGSAADIPSLLRQLKQNPSAASHAEPWFSLWSALAHQGDVYSASFAAVPYIAEIIAEHPDTISDTYFQFISWTEICRQSKNMTVPLELSQAYVEALQSLPKLIFASANRVWDRDFLRSALAALSVAKGDVKVAEVITELSDDVLVEFFDWFASR